MPVAKIDGIRHQLRGQAATARRFSCTPPGGFDAADLEVVGVFRPRGLQAAFRCCDHLPAHFHLHPSSTAARTVASGGRVRRSPGPFRPQGAGLSRPSRGSRQPTIMGGCMGLVPPWWQPSWGRAPETHPVDGSITGPWARAALPQISASPKRFAATRLRRENGSSRTVGSNLACSTTRTFRRPPWRPLGPEPIRNSGDFAASYRPAFDLPVTFLTVPQMDRRPPFRDRDTRPRRGARGAHWRLESPPFVIPATARHMPPAAAKVSSGMPRRSEILGRSPGGADRKSLVPGAGDSF